MTSLKEQLEDKDCEVRRLQERLVRKTEGEGVDVLDRGETDGPALIPRSVKVLWATGEELAVYNRKSPSGVWVQ